MYTAPGLLHCGRLHAKFQSIQCHSSHLNHILSSTSHALCINLINRNMRLQAALNAQVHVCMGEFQRCSLSVELHKSVTK